MSELVERAKAFALEAHKGQKRWNREQTPMTTHLEEVAFLVEQSGGNEAEIAAAWLHDVVEDTTRSLDDIRGNFGVEVAAIVDGLTDPPGSYGILLEHKFAQARRIREESDSVKRVKIADQTSNVRAVAVDPPVHWNAQKCLDYAQGAREIVEQCLGISSFLEEEFFNAYDVAVMAHTPAG